MNKVVFILLIAKKTLLQSIYSNNKKKLIKVNETF